MLWFKNAYDRASAADYALRVGMTEEYAPGYFKTALACQSLGAVAIMQYYPQRNVYDRAQACLEAVENPFYRVDMNYVSPAGDAVNAAIEFNDQFAYVKRSSEYTSKQPTRPNEKEIWDQAMAALDEMLVGHARALGWGSLAVANVELIEISAEEHHRQVLAA